MTQTYSGRDVYEGLKVARSEALAEQVEWKKVARSIDQATASLPKQIDEAWRSLVEVVVPSLDAPALDRAAAGLALPQVAARSVAAARQRDQQENAAVLAALAKEPWYVEREARKNGAQIRLAEVEEAIAPLATSVEALRAEPCFDELIGVGYATESYAGKFWQASYYRHWKHGDLVVEKHGKRLDAADFAAVRKKYLAESEALAALTEERDAEVRAIDTVHAHEERHARATAALAALDARALAWARGRVREHLASLPADEMTALVQTDPAWRVAGARVLGLTAKQAYLSGMRREVIGGFEQEAQRMVGDLEREIVKMSRPKKWSERVDDATYVKRIRRARRDKWRKRRQELDGARRAVWGFDRYDSYDPVRDLLWWNVMTGNRYSMPLTPAGKSAALWGNRDDEGARFAAAHASARARTSSDIDRDVS